MHFSEERTDGICACFFSIELLLEAVTILEPDNFANWANYGLLLWDPLGNYRCKAPRTHTLVRISGLAAGTSASLVHEAGIPMTVTPY